MDKYEVVDLLFTMCDATSAIMKGASYDETIAFIKRQHKDLDGALLEAFRDALGPVSVNYKQGH